MIARAVKFPINGPHEVHALAVGALARLDLPAPSHGRILSRVGPAGVPDAELLRSSSLPGPRYHLPRRARRIQHHRFTARPIPPR
jgi:hypothetical protein